MFPPSKRMERLYILNESNTDNEKNVHIYIFLLNFNEPCEKINCALLQSGLVIQVLLLCVRQLATCYNTTLPLKRYSGAVS
jgi:hypothetical protein